MSTISTSVNHLLAGTNPYIRQSSAVTKNASDFAQSLLGDLKPGDKVTARTDYTVDRNGQLQRSGKTVRVNDLAEQAQLPVLPYSATARPQSFADLSKPRVKLDPSEESRVFDADSIESGQGQNQRYFDEQGAEDENGEAIEVEILAPDADDREVLSLAAQRQKAASNLYARNNDIAYLTTPAFAFAA